MDGHAPTEPLSTRQAIIDLAEVVGGVIAANASLHAALARLEAAASAREAGDAAAWQAGLQGARDAMAAGKDTNDRAWTELVTLLDRLGVA